MGCVMKAWRKQSKMCIINNDDEEQIITKSKELGAQISKDYEGNPPSEKITNTRIPSDLYQKYWKKEFTDIR